MANRVILGKRGTSDYGLSVSRDGVNVADSSSTVPYLLILMQVTL